MPMSDRPAGDSAEQRDAETLILAALSAEIGVQLAQRRFVDARGAHVDVDGVAEDGSVLVEAWAHQGPPKPAQKAKVAADALKLIWVDRSFYGGQARKILALADPVAAMHFQGGSWIAAALTDLGIEVCVVPLDARVRASLRAAQERQFR